VIQLDTLRGVREQYWGAANLVLVVVGRIAPADALDRAAQYLGALPSGTQNARRPVSQPGPTAGLVRSDAGQQQALFRIAYPAPGLLDADRAAMTVLNGMMASGSGRLYRELRTLRGLAYSAGSVYPTYTDAGAWYATAGVDPENLDEALSVTRAEIERLRREPPTAAEVEHTIGLVSGRQVLNDETNAARATRLSSQAVLGSEPIESFLPRVRAVTPADVLRVAQSYFAPEHAVTITVGPPQE
ncbi:MAG: hypothetical protein QOF51_1592, partial [Chloroflexota bacterium]|nr:hypothetical protein [Chloroflexota bacterium]